MELSAVQIKILLTIQIKILFVNFLLIYLPWKSEYKLLQNNHNKNISIGFIFSPPAVNGKVDRV